MAEKKRQHMIPKSYMKSWAYPHAPAGNLGKVWVVQKADPTQKHLESPKSYFYADDRYTVTSSGERDLRVEDALALTETWYGQVIKNVRAGKILDEDDRTKLAFFTSAMMVRTNHMPGVLSNVFRTIKSQAERLEAKHNAKPGLSKDMAAKLETVVADTVRAGALTGANVLFGMNLSIFVADDEAGFVTGDEPCSIIVPGARDAYPGHPDVEILMPLSPHYMAFYSRKVPSMMYTKWNRQTVDRANSRTIRRCKKEFVSWKGIVRSEWFVADMRTPND